MPVRTILVLALLLTGLNATKPFHIDDYHTWQCACEFAKHPQSPYAFEVLLPTPAPASKAPCPPTPIPAFKAHCPPLLPYWGALGVTLFGDQPVFLKLWMFPFALLLVAALSSLLGRFAPTVVLPLLWMTVLSPVLLPGFNWVLEVPVLGLGLSALVIAMRACDRRSWGLTLLAGLLAGLAMQTKYTAFVLPVLIVLWCALMRRPWQGLLAAALAVLVFVSCEVFLFLGNGECYFVCQFEQRRAGPLVRGLRLVLPLMTLVGGLAPAVGLLALTALGWSRRWVVAMAFAVALCYLVVVFVPPSWAVFVRNPDNQAERFSLYQIGYSFLAVLTCGGIVAVTWRLLTTNVAREDWFLVLWLVVELGGYFALSPFPAARRVLGVIVVATLLVARLASRTCAIPERWALVRGIAGMGVVLGLLFFWVDRHEARAAKDAIESVARQKQELAPNGTLWHLVWHGARYYGEHAGLKPYVFTRSSPQPGDVLIVADETELLDGLLAQERHPVQLLNVLTFEDDLPVRTVLCYYLGRAPMTHLSGARVTFRAYRFVAKPVVQVRLRNFFHASELPLP